MADKFKYMASWIKKRLRQPLVRGLETLQNSVCNDIFQRTIKQGHLADLKSLATNSDDISIVTKKTQTIDSSDDILARTKVNMCFCFKLKTKAQDKRTRLSFVFFQSVHSSDDNLCYTRKM